MQPHELIALVTRIKCFRAESQTIELKAAKKGCPTRLYDTLSSFSNQNDGGILIFGIDEKDYDVVGVYDAQDLMVQVNNQCKQMSPMVRCLFTVCEIDSKIIVSAEVPGVDVAQRPVFYSGAGRIKGSYVRVGDSDEPMSEAEIYSYESFKKRIMDDIKPIDSPNLAFIDNQKIANYIQLLKVNRPNFSSFSDEQILKLMGLQVDNVPTLTSLLCFSQYPQGCYSRLCIFAVVVGSGDTSNDRFLDNLHITGTIDQMTKQACAFVERNMRKKTIINAQGQREDKTEYPIIAIRELIINALAHRDYSLYSLNIPVCLTMYRDKIEIVNPGGLFGRATIRDLGNKHLDVRNPILTDTLENLSVIENRFSGIPTIINECRKLGLKDPEFTSVHGEFKAIIYNDYYAQYSSQEKLMEFCESPRSRSELDEFLGYSHYYNMNSIIQPLVDAGQLKMTIPDKPKSKNQRFVKA